MQAEPLNVELLADFPGVYSLAKLTWPTGSSTFREVVGDAIDAATLSATMKLQLAGSLVSSCWEQVCSLGGPGWVHLYEAA